MKEIPLGQPTVYADTYDPELLVAVSRQPIRDSLNIKHRAEFGTDIWNIYEASWLNLQGKPVVACVEMSYAANSPAIVESKSLKLYFNSMNQAKFENTDSFLNTVRHDLTKIVGAEVDLQLIETIEPVNDWQSDYRCLDDLDVSITAYEPAPEILASAINEHRSTKQRWVSHLFKTNCMITGQPDWGSVFIEYEGAELDEARLLSYLISFRNHQAFHEPSCEMIFDHLMQYCQPAALSVYCRYTRRGGIDINPYRATFQSTPPNLRLVRQ